MLEIAKKKHEMSFFFINTPIVCGILSKNNEYGSSDKHDEAPVTMIMIKMFSHYRAETTEIRPNGPTCPLRPTAPRLMVLNHVEKQ